MSSRVLLLRVGMVAISLWMAKPARGCECLESNSCQMVGLSGAVFTGTAVSITGESKELLSTTSNGQRVRSVFREIVARFQIQKVLKGLPLDQKTVEVRTAPEGGMCGIQFKVGETYLVYAHRLENGGLSTSICSRTKPLAEAKDEIPLIESFLAGRRLTAILGTVGILPSDSLPAGLGGSVAEGMEVEVRGNRQSFKTTVDPQGMFRFWDVPEGTYTIRAVLSPAYEQLNRPHKVSIRPGACSVDTYVILPAFSGVRGRILNSNQRPVAAGTKVSLFDTNPGSSRPRVISSGTDTDGRYRFEHLLPGRYIISVGDVYYGTDLSKAPIIDLWSTMGAGVDIQLGK